jgi:hypothetical protein
MVVVADVFVVVDAVAGASIRNVPLRAVPGTLVPLESAIDRISIFSGLVSPPLPTASIVTYATVKSSIRFLHVVNVLILTWKGS